MTRLHSFTKTGYEDFIREVWDVRPLPWQLEDWYAFLKGGIFAYSIPTYHGKSMGVEVTHCGRLVEDPNRRQIAVKSNDTTANEMTMEVVRRLQFIGTELRSGGAPAFPWVEPMVRWPRVPRGQKPDPWRDSPYAVKDGFDVLGIDHRQRHRSAHSFRAYGIGDKDLQGKGGDTSIDDVETLAHADSEAERKILATRLDGIVRTLEMDPMEVLWLLVGTPMYSESVYNLLTERLEGIPAHWERIIRPFQNADGSYLWPEQAEKVQIMKAMMSKRAWSAAYELSPPAARNLGENEIERWIRDESMPWIENERQFAAWLLDWAMHNCPPYVSPSSWRKHVEQNLGKELAFYICWDPATEGDWAIVVLAMWGDNMWLLRCRIDDGDTWEQMQAVKDCFLIFPSAVLMLETNGQQKVFLDVAREDDLLRNVAFVRHTSQGKQHPQAGLPAMIEALRQGYLRCPWGDPGRAELEFGPFERELRKYSPTAHPHGIMATWFGWRYHRRSRLGHSIRRRMAAEELKRQTETVKIRVPQPAPTPTFGGDWNRNAWIRERSRKAWRRHGR